MGLFDISVGCRLVREVELDLPEQKEEGSAENLPFSNSWGYSDSLDELLFLHISDITHKLLLPPGLHRMRQRTRTQRSQCTTLGLTQAKGIWQQGVWMCSH